MNEHLTSMPWRAIAVRTAQAAGGAAFAAASFLIAAAVSDIAAGRRAEQFANRWTDKNRWRHGE